MLINLTRVQNEKPRVIINTEQIAFIKEKESGKGSTIIFATEVDWELDVQESIDDILYKYFDQKI